MSAEILECFTPISYLFREPLSAFNAALAPVGLKWGLDQPGAAVNQSDLDRLYEPHLQTLMRRTEQSLAASGFDALVIHAGCPPTLFLDDQDYPYKVNPH